MPRTTDKADKILEFVNDFIQENGYAPSVREIGQAVGLRSTASVSYHLNNMKESGKLRATGTKGAKRATVTTARPGHPTSAFSRRDCGGQSRIRADQRT